MALLLVPISLLLVHHLQVVDISLLPQQLRLLVEEPERSSTLLSNFIISLLLLRHLQVVDISLLPQQLRLLEEEPESSSTLLSVVFFSGTFRS